MNYKEMNNGIKKSYDARKKKSISKNSVREMLPGAVEEFLNKGGKITKIEPLPDYDEFMKYQPDPSNADQFLMGAL